VKLSCSDEYLVSYICSRCIEISMQVFMSSVGYFIQFDNNWNVLTYFIKALKYRI
jgi:hypothetical protein